MAEQQRSVAEIFKGSVHQSWSLEWLPKWTAALSAVRLLLALRKADRDTDPAWRQVERAAAALLRHERSGLNLGTGSGGLDAPRRRLSQALLRLAQAQEIGADPAPPMLQVLLAAECFPWSELPEAKYVCRALAACAKFVGR